MIRKATNKDIDAVVSITDACSKYMIEQNIYQWNELYPNREVFEKDIEKNTLYVLESSSEIIGCIVLSSCMDEEYIPVKWLTKNGNNLYIHRLAVFPKKQGLGYARQLMDFAETFAVKNNYNSIRLDTFSQNLRNQMFYEIRGYIKLEKIYFPEQSDHPFFCYELIL